MRNWTCLTLKNPDPLKWVAILLNTKNNTPWQKKNKQVHSPFLGPRAVPSLKLTAKTPLKIDGSDEIPFLGYPKCLFFRGFLLSILAGFNSFGYEDSTRFQVPRLYNFSSRYWVTAPKVSWVHRTDRWALDRWAFGGIFSRKGMVIRGFKKNLEDGIPFISRHKKGHVRVRGWIIQP